MGMDKKNIFGKGSTSDWGDNLRVRQIAIREKMHLSFFFLSPRSSSFFIFFSFLFFHIKKRLYIYKLIMSEPLLSIHNRDDQDFGEDIALDNSWVPIEKRPSFIVSFFVQKLIKSSFLISIYCID